ncbi:carbohydrate kinase [Phocaeicola abscessus]|mgnify:FL=1|uniref:carbohydrate kinase family protein n=1 Tax=Phocaeicola abscessus TaxID=555313 RepID=UPI0003867F04|nr:carbohydrate kinase [Phocaeicola abscessus]EPT34368.1 carbohydrate kinase, PfkB family [Bacteroidetes bacterium oral taxon 272 str. F0290]
MIKDNLVIGLGEILWDVLPEGKKLGGAPANFAYHASQFGLNAMAVSAIGQDPLGDETLRALESKGLDYYIERIEYPTGTVQVRLDANGIPHYEIKEGVAWDNIPYTDSMKQLAQHCRAVCFGSLAQRNNISRRTIAKFLDTMPEDREQLKIFDINLRQEFYSEEVIDASLRRCNVLKINEEEIMQVKTLFEWEETGFETVCRKLLERYGLKMVILTCGVNGSYVFMPRFTSFQPTPHVKVADTVGAGDSFTGAFTAAIMNNLPITEAHELAVKVSAYVCTQQGAMPKIPEALRKFAK